MEMEKNPMLEHPIFSMTIDDFETDLRGAHEIWSEPFLDSAGGFPFLPREIPFKLLYLLGTHFTTQTLNTQRNFWAYLMMECSTDTYQKFVELHSDKIRERVSPTC